MSNTSSMTWDQSHDADASSKKRSKTCDDGIPRSDLNHDVLSFVMMKLGIVDFVAFCGVCKSWRSLALFNKNKFMVSQPPVVLHMSPSNNKELYFKDFKGRMSKLIIPHLSDMKLIGVSHGYLILFRMSTLDLYLVNPITKHTLHFPMNESVVTERFMFACRFTNREQPRVILVFSPSLSGWVLVVLHRENGKLWYCVAGKGKWNKVFSNFFILDVIAIKGKIYTLIDDTCRICELELHPKPKLTLLETKNFPNLDKCFIHPEFVSSDENLHVWVISDCLVFELDFRQMKWVMLEKKKEDYTFFVSEVNHDVALKQETWADPRLQYKHGGYGCAYVYASLSGRFLFDGMWYFPHQCLNIDLIDE